MSIGNLPENLSQRILAGIILVGRLGVQPRATWTARAIWIARAIWTENIRPKKPFGYDSMAGGGLKPAKSRKTPYRKLREYIYIYIYVYNVYVYIYIYIHTHIISLSLSLYIYIYISL